jgi:hypothetical protein
MPNLSIRGVEEAALQRIKSAAGQRGVSVNAYLVELIRRESGLAPTPDRRRHHDLDALAGTWSEADALAFAASQQDFSRADPALWPDRRADENAAPPSAAAAQP